MERTTTSAYLAGDLHAYIVDDDCVSGQAAHSEYIEKDIPGMSQTLIYGEQPGAAPHSSDPSGGLLIWKLN